MKYLYNYYLHVQDILISSFSHNKYFWSIDTQVKTRYMCQYYKICITSRNSCINISTDYNMVPHSHTDWQVSIHMKNPAHWPSPRGWRWPSTRWSSALGSGTRRWWSRTRWQTPRLSPASPSPHRGAGI